MDELSFLGNAEIETIEKLYIKFKEDPESLEKSWLNFFKGYEFARIAFPESENIANEHLDKEFKVINLIDGYRKRGHLFTKTNPVRIRRVHTPSLDIENYGLSSADLETIFQAGKEIKIGPAPLKDIIKFLEETYCRSIGSEYMFIRNPEKAIKTKPILCLKRRKRFFRF
jgi:2-oxoglutarate dehydrogenase E1 component